MLRVSETAGWTYRSVHPIVPIATGLQCAAPIRPRWRAAARGDAARAPRPDRDIANERLECPSAADPAALPASSLAERTWHYAVSYPGAPVRVVLHGLALRQVC